MARDPRKNSAFESGMRGKEQAKTKAETPAAAPPGGGEKQTPGGKVGEPDGASAFSSGMRGSDKPKPSMTDAALQSATKAVKKPGNDGANTEVAGSQVAPEGPAGILGEEDDTDIYLKVPKSSITRKAAAAPAS